MCFMLSLILQCTKKLFQGLFKSFSVFCPKMSLSKTSLTSAIPTPTPPFLRLQSDQEEGGGSLLLQSFGHSLHSRERLIQVGEAMRADRTQSCKRRWNPLPAAVLRLTGMLFVSEVTAHPLKWQFSDCACVCCLKPSFVSRHIFSRC